MSLSVVIIFNKTLKVNVAQDIQRIRLSFSEKSRAAMYHSG